LETFTDPKDLAENPNYQDQRRRTLDDLSDGMIDFPIIELINGINTLPYCFTLQSCYGHFTYRGQKDPHNLEPLPITDAITSVAYRIAYICFCVENNELGKGLLDALNEITVIDRENIQFCCAEWFWRKQVNSYALQVEPVRFRHKDNVILRYREALHIEKTRNAFFVQLRELFHTKQRAFNPDIVGIA
jgi:hypothetical protein